MFRDVRGALRRLEGTHNLPVSVEIDDDGYFDRQCYAPDCMFQFKVHAEDWLGKVAMKLSVLSAVTLPTPRSGPLKNRPTISGP